VGGRTTNQGYVGDDVRQKFTQKERDTETNLDYFGARYYASTQGRFTGVDPVRGDLFNPQATNKYRYGLNNPLKFVDKNGLYEEDVHRELTYVLALAAGFSSGDAAKAAAADQWMDDNPETAPERPLNWEARRDYHFTTLERRTELWNGFSNEGSFSSLGAYMHAEQDSYSHEGYGYLLGHLRDGHAPDKTYKRVGRADRMAADSYEKLVDAISIMLAKGTVKTKYAAVPLDEIRDYIHRFNKARKRDDKRKILGEAVQAILRYRREHSPDVTWIADGRFGCIPPGGREEWWMRVERS
jgi:RHS repeat-associated protein